MRYLVTTYADRLPTTAQLLMVDGTVPGWTARPGDRHWDHHRPGGAEIQIEEIPLPERIWVEDVATEQPPCIVTTLLDADACCAAAWLQLPREVLAQTDTLRRLRAIAWDCDHLLVPPDLDDLADFAFKVGATLHQTSQALKVELGLPADRADWTQDDWERYQSEGFARGTQWLMAAARGDRPWPGTQGEADDYGAALAADQAWLLAEQRVQLLDTPTGAIALCDVRGLGRSLDPRAFYRALVELAPLEDLRPETLLWRDHSTRGGFAYTLGCIPRHPAKAQLDYTAGTFAALTAAEHRHNPAAEPWGGRRTVGGSGWNTGSGLTPIQVVAAIEVANH